MSEDENAGRLSSVAEHRFGKAEVESSILSDGTTCSIEHPRVTPVIIARFWSHVEIPSRRNHNLCWRWNASVDRHGYGQFKITTRSPPIRAHRFAYEVLRGKIPNGLHILHSCDNPRCCNPEHLRIGTHAENMADTRGKR